MKASLTQTWPCFMRLLLLGKKDHQTHVFTENTAGGWRNVKAIKERRHERNINTGSIEGLSSSPETVCASFLLPFLKLDHSNHQQREALFHHHTPKAILSNHANLSWISPPANNKLASDPQRCTSVDALSNRSKYHGCLMSRTCLQHWRNPQNVSGPSLMFPRKRRSQLFQNSLACSQHFIRPLSSSTHKLWILNHFHTSLVPHSLTVPESRAVRQTTSYQATSFRDFLSLENEMRCRQTLGPNLKLYELNTVNGAAQSQGIDVVRWASILVSLCSLEGDPAFLFTLRSSTLKGRHKGHVSFAGGKNDPSDSDVVDTALREAWEEIGVNVATENVWGVFKPLKDSSGLMVVPVLANLGPLESLSLKPNPSEVEEIFTLPLSHLCNPQNRGYTHFRTGDKYGYTMPVFRNGKYRVWGLTAVALDNSLKLIVPP